MDKTTHAITYDTKRNRWIIDVPTHVSIKFKRWFAKLGKNAAKHFVLSHSGETARDLAMFAHRYGLTMTESDKSRLHEASRRQKEKEEFVRNLISDGECLNDDFELAVPARKYQKVAAAIALQTGGLLIADPLGSGKTASAICALTKPESLPAIVVSKVHLLRQWQAELKKFAPILRTHIATKGTPYDFNARYVRTRGQGSLLEGEEFQERGVDVFIINYHKLSGWIDALLDHGFKVIVFDECQEGRRAESNKYDAMALLAKNIPIRIGTSATPIYNYGGEFYNVMECIQPGALGTKQEFITEWCEIKYSAAPDKEIIKHPAQFGSWLREQGLMLRRERDELGLEVPELTNIPHYIQADLDSLKELSASCADLARSILNMNGASLSPKERGITAAQFDTKLRQATGIAKAVYIAEFVKMLLESGEEKILLAAWHREVYTILLEKLAAYEPVMFTGSESQSQKYAASQAFINGKARVFIMSLRSGEGLDGLQSVCRTIVIGELDWSPAVHEQIIGRLNRPGQKQPVLAYYLFCEHGSDPAIADTLGIKKDQFEGIVNLDKLAEIKQVDPNHIANLARNYLSQIGTTA